MFNNKGKPVRQYEPFFTDDHSFEFEVRIGVSPVLFYDPVGRVIATLHPNHTWEKVVFDPWRQETLDVSDTVLVADPKNDADVGDFFRRLPDADYLPTWHALRQNGVLGPQEQDAARKAAIHSDTPTVAHLDSLGHSFFTVAQNKFKRSDAPPADPPVKEFYGTRTVFDIEGNQREVIDAKDRTVMRYDYDMLGNRAHQASMEAGERWTLTDVAGKPIRAWDSRGHGFRTVHDQLQRPTESFAREGVGPERLVGRTVYGETQPNPEVGNLRGQSVRAFDQAGVVTSEDYDFKGNLLHSRRQVAREYKMILDWSASVTLEAKLYASSTRYDALNRPTELTTPDNSVVYPTYNEANLLNAVKARLRGAAVATPFVSDIRYDAKGQREQIQHGNGARITYEYDPLTFRLLRLLTQRNATAFPTDCPQPPPVGWPGCQVQNLRYTYDPAGNVTHIRDDAQQTIYFRNRRVEPSAEYTYDAIHRLIEATGREHLGQAGGQPNPPVAPDNLDSFHTRLDHPGDGDAMGTYVERYIYDAVGNMLAMQHRGSDPAHPGWTRTYAYNETSKLEPERANNRLSSTTVGNTVENYRYDGTAGLHGNITSMPHLPLMRWDYHDQLRATSRQEFNVGTPETTWYIYDGGGQRVRKVTERQAAAGQTPTRKQERIYLGGFEIYREFAGDGTTVTLERETLHVAAALDRVALIETRTVGNDPAPEQLIRYQYTNHLGSAVLELDDDADIISYEEYLPYGSTAYQAVRGQTETPKRYRYSGKERDEENDLYHHGARYYAPWLGRWTSCDPAGLMDGHNLYRYVSNNPLSFSDPSGRQKSDAVGTISTHRKHERSLYDALGNRISEDEHVIPKASQKAVTRDPTTGLSDFTERHYQNNTTVRVEKSMANEKTRGGPTSDNARSAALKQKALTGTPMDVNQELLVDSLDNAKRARTATGSVITDDQLHKTALAEMGELFETHGHDTRKKVELSWERMSDAEIQKEQQSLQRASESAKKLAPEKAADTSKAVLNKADDVAEAAAKPTTKALETVAEKGGMKIATKLGTKALKVVPFVGMGASLYSMKAEAAQGNYGAAALEGVGMVPVVGDVVDAARLGVAVGETASEALGIEEVATEHGMAVEGAARSLGFSQDTSRLIGATGAALSSITVAPQIALQRKIAGWFR
ncbi:MAG TPA: RHS repeat-associated core domain-containing protein [Rubrobacter sp.]|nr:RHS repeat-associated core domain-containing protein [Rubrobacter sp.]